ncbi:unnamed protein product [Eruca vesicaria subsp. sativa]|uniref:Uncharacterized protein n=1 Tax=Eruca vesicaria subsp. sativa TaxID=29727 RepID=A0ABC8KCI0_ERUVS|nr:unnamed protein product [Eruca vesicaria subsp. sativa]
MASSSSPAHARVTTASHQPFSCPLLPTNVTNLRLPAACFTLRFKSNFLSAALSSRQTRSVPVPVVFDNRRRRRSMEPGNVYVRDSFVLWF